MPYSRYGQTDPTEQYQGSAFNPMTGRLSGAQLVMEFLARQEMEKQKKQQAGWDVEDREMKKKLTEAQMGNLDEVTAPRPVAQKGYKLPASTLKEVSKYHGFTDESEYGSYDPQFQQDMAKEYMDAKTAATARGLKFTPNKAGAIKLKMIDTALAQINKRAGEVSGEYRAMIMQPLSDPTGEGKEISKRTLSNLNRLRMRFSTYPWKMDESGVLPEPYERELMDYLNSPDAVETGRAFETQKPSGGIPPEVLAAAKKARPDLTEQEIIDAWKARKK